MMNHELKQALAVYGRSIQKHGWSAGEPLIRKAEKRHAEFRRWAYALGILLRAEEILSGRPSCRKAT